MAIQEITSVEQWFEFQASALKLATPTPNLAKVKDVLQHNLRGRVNRLSRHIAEPENAANWLEIILKSNALIRLWPSPEKSVTVAIDCSGNLKLTQEQLVLVRSPEFSAARQDLGIDKYWFLVITGYPLQVPKQSELLDALYAQLAQEDECSIVQLSNAAI